MDVHIKILSMSPCLHGFGMNDLKQLMAITSKAFWKSGEVIFTQRDPGRDMFIICSGKVRIWRENGAKGVSLASLSVGESFGEMGLVELGERSASATAIQDTLALRICYDQLFAAPDAASLLYRNIARALAKRLEIANNVIVFQSQTGGQAPQMETIDGRKGGIKEMVPPKKPATTTR